MCEFENRLIAWMDCELEADEALEIERHLRICTACSARATSIERSAARLRAIVERSRTRKNSRRLRWAAWSATAARGGNGSDGHVDASPPSGTIAVPASGCPESACDGFSNRAGESAGAGRTDSPAAEANSVEIQHRRGTWSLP